MVFGFGTTLAASIAAADDTLDNTMSIVDTIEVVVDPANAGIHTTTNAAVSADARIQAAQGEMLALEPTSPSPPASATPPEPTRRTANSKTADQPVDTILRRRGDTRQSAAPQVSQAMRPKPPVSGERLRLTLEQALEIALEHNLPVQIARLTRDALLPAVRQAEAAFHPTVAMTATRSFTKTATTGAESESTHKRVVGGSLTQPLPTGGSVVLSTEITRADPEGDNDRTDPTTGDTEYSSTATITVTQPLLRGGRIFVARKAINDAEFDLRIETANLRSQILSIASLIKTNYYNMILAADTIRVTQAAINRSKTLIQASEALLRAQLTTIRDVLSARIQLTQDSANLISAKADLETARNNILDTLGYPIGTELELLDTNIGFKAVQLNLDQLIDKALKSRPELMRIDYQIAKSKLNVRTAENSVLPKLDAVGSYSRTQTDGGFGTVIEPDGSGWSLGLAFSVPIGNVAAKSALSKAKIDHNSLRRQRTQQIRQIELAVRTAVIKLNSSLARRGALEAVLDQARQLEAVAKSRFSRGLATNLDITDAQADIRDAETDLLTATVDYKCRPRRVGSRHSRSDLIASIAIG